MSTSTPEDFTALFERHADAVYGFCFRRTADWALAEDLVSATFLEAWRHRDAVDLVTQPPLPWLLGVANNLLRNTRRSLRRHQAALMRFVPGDEADFADDADARLDDERAMRAVRAEVDKLPKREREVLELVAWSGLSYEDAAAALDVPVGTVRSRLSRARARLNTPELAAIAALELIP